MSSDLRVTRFTAIAALGVALLYLLSAPIGSLAELPATSASPATILHFFDQHRDGVLIAIALNGIAWCALMPTVFAGIRELLGEGGGLAATIALVCAGVEAALIGVALTFGALVAYAAPDISPELAKLLSDGFNIATSASAWPTVACMVGFIVAARRSELFPQAVVVLAVLVAILHAVTAVGFARSGAFSPSGIAVVGPPAFALLMVCVGVTLLRGAGTSRMPVARASTTVAASAGPS